MAKKIPQWLQPILWSVKIDHLDLEEDKAYIVNQILVYGGFKELRWLFRNYPKRTIREVFLHQPLKIYTPSTLNFAKEILLGLKDKKLDPYQYERDLSRVIRP